MLCGLVGIGVGLMVLAGLVALIAALPLSVVILGAAFIMALAF